MNDLSGLFAYPSSPAEIGDTISNALMLLRDRFGFTRLQSWEQNDVAGRFITDPLFQTIKAVDCLLADITTLNFNVTYEIGFALGRRRRVLLLRNSALESDGDLVRDIGIFDTLGYESYTNSEHLAEFVRGIHDISPLPVRSDHINKKAPVFVVSPRDKTDLDIRLTSRIKKARLQYRSFDPQEQGRLSGSFALSNVAESYGVVAPLLPKNREEHAAHNQRAAFVAGIAAGMDKTVCLLQFGHDPVPLDYRDLVLLCATPDHINAHIADFAPLVTEQLQQDVPLDVVIDAPWLAALSLGQSAAENEFQELGQYYIETDEYQRAKRGEVQVITGRKGSGKTALFGRLRDNLRRNKQMVVLDLKPEGYQLLEFMEVLRRLSQASREHVIAAFWEYLLLLEIANKLMQKDRESHLYNPDINILYHRLEDRYFHSDYAAEGDFAERMMALTEQITVDLRTALEGVEDPAVLSQAQLTELIYKHSIADLRDCLVEYLTHKDGTWILFDNLDKGWPPHGVRTDDLIVVRGLVDSIGKIRKSLEKEQLDCRGVVFLRNDVFELLLDATPDRGKVARANLDWSDPELLREMLRRRLVANEDIEETLRFDEVWPRVCVSHIDGEETSQYLIERSLMRPRGLLDLVNHCRSHAANLRHDKIFEEDILHGEEVYSTELVENIAFEVRDVYPEAEGVIFELLGENAWIEQAKLRELLSAKGLVDTQLDRVTEFLLWYGVLGIVRENAEPAYIYDMQYSARRMRSLLNKRNRPMFQINAAFWAGLEIQR